MFVVPASRIALHAIELFLFHDVISEGIHLIRRKMHVWCFFIFNKQQHISLVYFKGLQLKNAPKFTKIINSFDIMISVYCAAEIYTEVRMLTN